MSAGEANRVFREVRGVGVCPGRPDGFGHMWKSWREDPRKSCEFCGRPGRDNQFAGESGGFFAEATKGRTETMGSLNARRELTQEQKDRAALVVEDKRRRDAEAVKDGSARPGQVAGVKGQR
jgi:hypothetical protein